MILLLLLLIGLVDGLIQDWKFSEEARRQFLIERFGFGAGGRMELELVNVKSSSPIEKGKVGVFMKHVRVSCTESLPTNPSCPV